MTHRIKYMVADIEETFPKKGQRPVNVAMNQVTFTMTYKNDSFTLPRYLIPLLVEALPRMNNSVEKEKE